MYNPFPLLTTGLLEDELAKGKHYFVRQTFVRGWDAQHKATFLIRAYPAEEKEMAEQHIQTLQNDGNAFLYDAAIPDHREKLKIAASQPIGYKIFYAARVGTKWKPPVAYEQKMRNYIGKHHPGWRKIEIGLHEEFGELFLKFSHKDEEDTIPFDRIELY
ncbi:MAG: hypothetical protein JST68_19660 [Bacteroidetes bacterium]|nr:hypothetical protein [Bacteroidota bacterium]